MAQLTKQALLVENNTSFPNNNTGAITPTILRNFNTDMIDSTVNQEAYTTASALVDGRLDSLENFTGSALVTASAAGGTITFEKGDGSTFDLAITASVGSVDWDNITDKPSGLVSGSSQVVSILTSVNAFTSSADAKFATIGTQSGSWGGGGDVTALNAFTASQETKNTTLASYTGSVDTKFTTIGSVTASLNSFTASQETKNATLATYTGSNDNKWNTIGTQSGSWVTESETGSFARTDITNTFTQTQNIQGDLNITGTINATTIHTITESASVIYSSGSNVFGDDGLDTQTLNGATTINGDARLNGSSHQITGSLIQTGGNVTITGSILQSSGNATFTGSILSRGNNTFIGNQTITGTSKQTFNEPGDNQQVDVVKVNSFTDSNGYTMAVNTLGWYHYNSEGHEGFSSQLYTADYAYGSAFFHDPEKWEYVLFPSGAAYDTNKFGLYDVGGTKTKFVVLADNVELTGSVALTPASVSTNAQYPLTFISGTTISKDSVDTLVYNPSTNILYVSGTTGQSSISTNGIIFSSGSGTGANSSNITKNSITNIGTPGYYIGISGNPSLIGAPSLAASTKPAILALSSSVYTVIEFQNSGSFTDGRVTIKRPLVVEQGITGSVTVGGNLVANKVSAFDFDTLFYGSQMGGSTSNGTFLGYGSTNYEFVVGAYAGGFDNEFKITADNTGITFRDFNGSSYPTWLKLNPNSGTNPAPILTRGAEVTGSLSVSGSINTSVIPLAISSNTASLNAANGNTFQLNLVSGSATRLEVTGTKSGQTLNILVSQSASGPGTLVFGDNIVEPSGSFYSASQVASAEDILTLATFVNANKIYVANIKNLI